MPSAPRPGEPPPGADLWAAGDAYEPYIGRWSRLVAREFLGWLAAPAGARWLDVGCGTGALTGEIFRASAPANVQAIDPSPGFLAWARGHAAGRRAAFVAGDARALPLRSASVDIAVSGLAINFVPRPEVAVAEMARAVRAGGTVAAYVWDYAEGMQLIRRLWDAAAELDPAAARIDEATRFPICRPAALESLFRGARLREVESRAIDVPTHFRDFDDYWLPFLGGQGPAPGYVLSLAEERRIALRDRIRAALPAASDGSIRLEARAWAVRGRVERGVNSSEAQHGD